MASGWIQYRPCMTARMLSKSTVGSASLVTIPCAPCDSAVSTSPRVTAPVRRIVRTGSEPSAIDRTASSPSEASPTTWKPGSVSSSSRSASRKSAWSSAISRRIRLCALRIGVPWVFEVVKQIIFPFLAAGSAACPPRRGLVWAAVAEKDDLRTGKGSGPVPGQRQMNAGGRLHLEAVAARERNVEGSIDREHAAGGRATAVDGASRRGVSRRERQRKLRRPAQAAGDRAVEGDRRDGRRRRDGDGPGELESV